MGLARESAIAASNYGKRLWDPDLGENHSFSNLSHEKAVDWALNLAGVYFMEDSSVGTL